MKERGFLPLTGGDGRQRQREQMLSERGGGGPGVKTNVVGGMATSTSEQQPANPLGQRSRQGQNTHLCVQNEGRPGQKRTPPRYLGTPPDYTSAQDGRLINVRSSDAPKMSHAAQMPALSPNCLVATLNF